LANVVELHLRFPKRIVELIDEIVKSEASRKEMKPSFSLSAKVWSITDMK